MLDATTRRAINDFWIELNDFWNRPNQATDSPFPSDWCQLRHTPVLAAENESELDRHEREVAIEHLFGLTLLLCLSLLTFSGLLAWQQVDLTRPARRICIDSGTVLFAQLIERVDRTSLEDQVESVGRPYRTA